MRVKRYRHREFSLGPLFWMALGEYSFCFRFFGGPGLWFAVRSRRDSIIPFSERYGYARFCDIGPFRIKPLYWNWR